MQTIRKEKEFLGKIAAYYIEDNYIWGYDEISLGLYKISLNTNDVELVLSPMQIHKDKILQIAAIIKREADLILVPQSANDRWIIYRTVDKSVEYVYPILTENQIYEVKQEGNIIYLIPCSTYDPIIIMSLKDMKLIKQIDNWYGLKNSSTEKRSCWPSTFDGSNVFLPINKSRYICKINSEEEEMIEIDIPYPISSISVNSNDIWILPVKGNLIYRSDYRGNLLDCIELTREHEITADQFMRIVATEMYVFLLPVEGDSIYIYKKSEKCVVKTNSAMKPLRVRYLMRLGSSYWGYHANDRFLYLLSVRYRYAVIDLATLEIQERKLLHEQSFNTEEYWKWYIWSKRNLDNLLFYDQGCSSLEEFIQLISVIPADSDQDRVSKTGGKIWAHCKSY